jgi:hypothetical protein
MELDDVQPPLNAIVSARIARRDGPGPSTYELTRRLALARQPRQDSLQQAPFELLSENEVRFWQSVLATQRHGIGADLAGGAEHVLHFKFAPGARARVVWPAAPNLHFRVSRFHGSLDPLHWAGRGLVPMPRCPAAVALGSVRGIVVRYDSKSANAEQLEAARRWIMQRAFTWAACRPESAQREQPLDIIVFATEQPHFSAGGGAGEQDDGAPHGGDVSARIYDECPWPDAFPGSGDSADGWLDPERRVVTFVLAPATRPAYFCQLGAIDAFEQPVAYAASDYAPIAGTEEDARAHVSDQRAARLAVQPSTLWSLGAATLQPLVAPAVRRILADTLEPIARYFFSDIVPAAYPVTVTTARTSVALLGFDIACDSDSGLAGPEIRITLVAVDMARVNHVASAGDAHSADPVVVFHMAQLVYLIVTSVTRAYDILWRCFGEREPALRASLEFGTTVPEIVSSTVLEVWSHLERTRYAAAHSRGPGHVRALSLPPAR